MSADQEEVDDFIPEQKASVLSATPSNGNGITPLVGHRAETVQRLMALVSISDQGQLTIDAENADKLMRSNLRLDATVNMCSSDNSSALTVRWRRLDRPLEQIGPQEEAEALAIEYSRYNGDREVDEDVEVDDIGFEEESEGNHHDQQRKLHKKARKTFAKVKSKTKKRALARDTTHASPETSGFLSFLMRETKRAVNYVANTYLAPFTDHEQETAGLKEAEMHDVINSKIDASLIKAHVPGAKIALIRNILRMAFKLNGEDYSPLPGYLKFAVTKPHPDPECIRVHVQGFTEIRLRYWVDWIMTVNIMVLEGSMPFTSALETRRGILGFALNCDYVYDL